MNRRNARAPAGPPTVAPGLWHRERARGPEYFTRALGTTPSLRGEPLVEVEGRPFRRFEPTRSKVAAALVLGWDGPIPGNGEAWLYLGAAAGTTASHVADLVGATAPVYAVEPSVRPFLQLLAIAETYPNLLPILGDARRPESYGGTVPLVDGIYCDVAQPDQPEIVAANAAAFLRPGGRVLFVVKTASLGREPNAAAGLRQALDRLPDSLRPVASRSLEPFHRRHYLVAAEHAGTSSSVPPPPPRPAGGRIRPRSVRPGR
ncbi:MAG TPA: fibrillarin-like rRNA/tRNA 2'-O-methyltransferase [Thermoplasmata archaeon]|nr:fibrillarin-like rRNA/tRNA 2'-O-methyltransferase [Thermoplasmata archaeon]